MKKIIFNMIFLEDDLMMFTYLRFIAFTPCSMIILYAMNTCNKLKLKKKKKTMIS